MVRVRGWLGIPLIAIVVGFLSFLALELMPSTGLFATGAAAVAVIIAGLSVGRAVVRRRVRALTFYLFTVLTAGGLIGLLLAFFLPVPTLVPGASSDKMVRDARADCVGCAQSERVGGLSVNRTGTRTFVSIALGGAPGDGAAYWLWFQDDPARPLELVKQPGGWRLIGQRSARFHRDSVEISFEDSKLVVAISSLDVGPVAVSSGGGDRAPDVSYVRAGGEGGVRTAPPTGSVSRTLAADLAKAQAGVAKLSPVQRRLAISMFARQQVSGTFTYRQTEQQDPNRQGRVVVTTDGFKERQDFFELRLGDPALSTSLLRLDDRSIRCTYESRETPECEDAAVEGPVSQVLAMQSEPSRVAVQYAPQRSEIAGRDALCFVITASTPKGPAEGERCAHPDGALAYSREDDSGTTLQLEQRSNQISADTFMVPT